MHEALGLGDDREGFVDESGEAPLRRDGAVAVPERALGGGAEGRDVIGKGVADLLEQVGALGQDVVAVAVGEPGRFGVGGVDDFLEAEDVGRAFRDVREECGLEFAAPGVEGHDLHGHLGVRQRVQG